MRMPFTKAHHAVVCIRHKDGYREHFDRDTRAATLRFLHELGACKHVPRQTIPDDRCHLQLTPSSALLPFGRSSVTPAPPPAFAFW